MRGLRPALVGLGIAGFAFALGSAAIILSSDHIGFAHSQTMFLVGHLLFIEVGVITWYRRPDNRFGSLMVLVGFVGLSSNLAASDIAGVFTAGVALSEFIPMAAALMLLAYPSGRLGRRERWVLGAFGAGSVGLGLPALLVDAGPLHFEDQGPHPANLLLIEPNATLVDVLTVAQGVVIAAAVAGAIAIFARRWREAGALHRKALQPVLLTGGLTAVLYGGIVAAEAAGAAPDTLSALEWSLVVYAVVPIAFLAGLVRGRMFGTGAVGSLMVELARAPARGELRDRLAAALGDPTLDLAYWLPEEERHVDARGRPAEPPGPGTGRAWTPVERDGVPVAAIIHDDTLIAANSDLVRAAGGAAALALENERLDAELRAKVDELAASRARIIDAADGARRRLERDLHDGAQQRLVGLALKLRLARAKADSDPEAVPGMIDDSIEELERALGELRELARGIHPAVLSQRGLEPALRALATRAPVPVNLTATLDARLPPPVEAAAYFVAAEALTNVAKYACARSANVSVCRESGRAVVEVRDDGVGGARMAPGSGLSGLADRVAALDGRLVVESPLGGGTRIRAEIPCAW